MHTIGASTHDVHAPYQHIAPSVLTSRSAALTRRADATDATGDKTPPGAPSRPAIRATDDEDVYRVQSESDPETCYRVDVARQLCTCPDALYRRNQQPFGSAARLCKHRALVQERLIDEALDAFVASLRPRHPVRLAILPRPSRPVPLAPLCSACYERPAAAGDTQCGRCLMAEVFPSFATPSVPGGKAAVS